ncbi:hypothetical protein CR513_28678, partial [Mucuna pruriens]
MPGWIWFWMGIDFYCGVGIRISPWHRVNLRSRLYRSRHLEVSFIRLGRNQSLRDKGSSGVGDYIWDGVEARSILVLHVDTWVSYNMIMGCPTLNRLGAMVSTPHLCMKYHIGKEVGIVWADYKVAHKCYEDSLRRSHRQLLGLDLDPRHQFEDQRPDPIKELKEVQISPSTSHRTKIGIALGKDAEDRLIGFLTENRDDESKTAFITDSGTFSYKVFGLKNVGTTYQRPMDRIFKDVMGTDMEIYVDDMMVKSTMARKFLGFMLTERGIEANPEKCQVVIDMRNPRNVKEAALIIFQTLKKGGNFLWSTKSEEAFQKMKVMLAAPPVLTKPTPGTPLLVYLSVVDDVVSATIVQEKEGNQCPGYHVIVRTDLPIWQILREPDLARRMVGWRVQLFEFDTSFKRRGHIRAQALVDFVIELALVGHLGNRGREWFLSVNGASNQSGSGAGVILEDPNGVLVEQSLRFEFKASNNQAEYEALLSGIKLAKELDNYILTAKSDSKLVIGQVNGEYQARDPQLFKYWDRVMKLAASFEKFTLLHVLCEQNERDDLLSKLTSTQRSENNRSVIHKKIGWPTVEEQGVCCVETKKTWMDPFLEYFKRDIVPNDTTQARKLMREASKYTLVGEHL